MLYLAETRHVLVRNCPVMDRSGLPVFSTILFTKEQRKEKSKKFNEFSKLSTKSCMSWTIQYKQFKIIMKSIITRTTTLKIYVTLEIIYTCKLKLSMALNHQSLDF